MLVSELSGRSNIMALAMKRNLQHDSALAERVLKEVVELENRGYQFEAAEASFDLLVQRLAGSFHRHFELLHYHVDVETNGDGETTTEATVKLRVGDEVRHEVAEGDGPVNALDAALRKALNGQVSRTSAACSLSITRSASSTAMPARRRRSASSSKARTTDGETWGTVGVNENVIKASWDALVDSIEYKLCKDERR